MQKPKHRSDKIYSSNSLQIPKSIWKVICGVVRLGQKSLILKK
ncbi:hypothetical protein LBBP_03691 [Leptospira borgpetersenii serovar Ballum]|uniref:Uncharacterized protein n=1 Tax=Leptospira borgpetersenii serovar Ballum TaxID=280505 RepID=A0A0S2IW52_LEPBO|nr:hypothetical protein LBBP_03691 [Leptospira borgpetersenii serovar Ballum]